MLPLAQRTVLPLSSVNTAPSSSTTAISRAVLMSFTVAFAIVPFVSANISFALPIFVITAVLLGFVSFNVPLSNTTPETFPFEVSIFSSAMFTSLKAVMPAAVMSALILSTLVAVPLIVPIFVAALLNVSVFFAAAFIARGLAFVPFTSTSNVTSTGAVSDVILRSSEPVPVNVMLFAFDGIVNFDAVT